MVHLPAERRGKCQRNYGGSVLDGWCGRMDDSEREERSRFPVCATGEHLPRSLCGIAHGRTGRKEHMGVERMHSSLSFSRDLLCGVRTTVTSSSGSDDGLRSPDATAHCTMDADRRACGGRNTGIERDGWTVLPCSPVSSGLSEGTEAVLSPRQALLRFRMRGGRRGRIGGASGTTRCCGRRIKNPGSLPPGVCDAESVMELTSPSSS